MAPRSLARLALLALPWGSSFLWIKLVLDGLSPVQLVLVRRALGAASLAGALKATTPLWTLGIGLAAGTESHMTPVRLVGLLIGFAGALVMAPGTLPAAACRPWSCRQPSSPRPPGSLCSSPRGAGRQPIQLSPAVLAAISILGALGTGAAYVLNYRLIADEGPTATSTVTYCCRLWSWHSASSSWTSQQPPALVACRRHGLAGRWMYFSRACPADGASRSARVVALEPSV